MVRDPDEAQALLDESKGAVDVLYRLIGRLEAFTDRLVVELDKRDEQNGEADGQR